LKPAPAGGGEKTYLNRHFLVTRENLVNKVIVNQLMRKCNSLMVGGSCFEQVVDGVYEVDMADSDQCSLNTNACLKDICLIDFKYARMIQNLFDNSHVILPGDDNKCEAFWNGTRQLKRCDGQAPELRFVPIDENGNDI